MADQLSAADDRNKKPNKFKKKTTRVDLTPMVDLGFLLITFFVFTSTMATSTTMAMVAPKESDITADKVCESCAITVLPCGNNTLYYYEGNEKTAIYHATHYGASGLRKLLTDKKHALAKMHREPVLIIKPAATASFGNLVAIIDESNICMYPRYYLDQPSPSDKTHIE